MPYSCSDSCAAATTSVATAASSSIFKPYREACPLWPAGRWQFPHNLASDSQHPFAPLEPHPVDLLQFLFRKVKLLPLGKVFTDEAPAHVLLRLWTIIGTDLGGVKPAGVHFEALTFELILKHAKEPVNFAFDDPGGELDVHSCQELVNDLLPHLSRSLVCFPLLQLLANRLFQAFKRFKLPYLLGELVIKFRVSFSLTSLMVTSKWTRFPATSGMGVSSG